MIITEQTPNPNSLKFISDKKIALNGTYEFQKKNLNKINNNFIKDLLNFDNIELVLLSENFITVKKTEEGNWEEIKPMVISHINDYFQLNNSPIFKKVTPDEVDKESDQTILKIKDVLDTKIRPAVARDGGDIKFKSFENGVVKVELQGSCSGCPSSLMTLKKGVQNLLKHYVKEVQSVEAI